MSKKIIASIVVLLMVLSIFSVASIGSVPKANAIETNLTVFMQPGVPDPYNPPFSLTLGTLRNHPEVIASDVQSQGSENSFAVLAGSTGDLMFTFTVGAVISYIQIYLPPDFAFTKPTKYSVWTDITNDYGYIGFSTRGVWNTVAPNWNRITIGEHAATFTGGYTAPTSPMDDFLVIQPGVYHVRILGLTAPSTVGVYHFKIATNNGFVPVEDFPIIIVKGEVNTAYVTGLVADNEGRSDVAGIVIATGTTADGRSISGIDMLSPEDECPKLLDLCASNGSPGAGYYRYYIFGLPAGSYTLNATMSGDTVDTSSRFTLAAGQSFHPSSNLGPGGGTTVYLNVFSKHGRGTIPWCDLWQPPFGTNDPSVCYDPTLPMQGAAAYDPATPTNPPRDINVILYDQAGNQLGLWGSDNYGVFYGAPIESKPPTDPTATEYSMGLTDTRDLPSIRWMAVPSDHADYVAGLTTGTNYNVKSYVTGYVMTDDDAFQRTFTPTGTVMTVEMDLRRSNWFAITAHEFNNLYDTTLAYAAVPSGTAFPVTPGTESGLAALWVAPASSRTADPTVIMEGWAEGSLAAHTWGNFFDYGLAPGTYDIHLMAADEGARTTNGLISPVGSGIYYIRSGDPFTASIALCNSPSSLSFRVRSIQLTLSLRSVDSEIPAHQRPWTFPGAEIWVNFLDSSGKTVASLDPTEYSWVYGLVQDNGNIGSPYDVDTGPAGEHGLLSMAWTGFNPDPEDVVVGNTGYPTSLPPGQYNFQVYTYGYIMERMFPVQVPDGGSGDIQADLIQGGMVRVALDFKDQNEKVPFNGFVRVELYDSSNKLVGANIYGMAQANLCDRVSSTCSVTGNYPDYIPANDFMHYQYVVTPPPTKEPAEGSNDAMTMLDGQRGYLSNQWYGVPGTTWANWVKMDPSDANRLNYDTTASQYFDLFGFHWYYGNPSSRNTGDWANGWETTDGTHQTDYGIMGSRDTPAIKGGGTYTVKVYAFDPYGQDGVIGTADDWASFYAGSAPTYAAATGLEIPWGGGMFVSITMNQMGRLSGTPTFLDMYGDMSYAPWTTLTAGSTFAPALSAIDASWGLGYSEPAYYMWLPAGTYTASVSQANAAQVFAPASTTVQVSDGWSGTYDQTLVPSGVAVPEFPATAFVVLLSALGASVYLLRRRRTPN